MINVFGSQIGIEELEEIKTSIDSSWMGMGSKVQQFETNLATRLNLPGLVMVDSGSNALYLAIKILNIPLGKKIIVPSFTWVSCASAIILAGYEPVFVEVEEDTQNISLSCVESIFDNSIGAILLVHYAGKPVDVDSFKKFGVPIIEDSAHAIDSKINDSYCGTLGDISIFSFDSIKNLATPEGGAIGSTNIEYLNLAKEYRYCGISKSGFSAASGQTKGKWWEYDIKHIWPKMLPNDICASIGLSQLRKLDLLQSKRKQIWNRYQQELCGIDWLKTPVDQDKNEQHSYFTYFIRIEKHRDDLANYLLSNGIYTTLRYHPLHMNPIYKSNVHLPITELLNQQGLNIPLHPGLSDSDLDKIITLIKKWK